MTQAPLSPPPALVIEQLHKAYPGDDGKPQPVLQIKELLLQQGEQLGLKGSSGCGKTTLLHCIAGILRPDSGNIFVCGEAMTNRSESQRDQLRARRIGYVFQSFNLLQGYTALENVALALQLAHQSGAQALARAMLERVGLADRLHYRPSQLSVGQQQRVALARAVVKKPDVILADEPTGNLDPARAQQAIELLREVAEETGAALLVVSHDPSILQHFPRCLDLREINTASHSASISSSASVGV